MPLTAPLTLMQQRLSLKGTKPFQCHHKSAQSRQCRQHTAASATTRSHKLPQASQNATRTLLPAALALALNLLQPSLTLADATTPTPPPAATSSAFNQAASRTVVDIVGGENTVLNEENAQTNRDNEKAKAGEQQQDSKAR